MLVYYKTSIPQSMQLLIKHLFSAYLYNTTITETCNEVGKKTKLCNQQLQKFQTLIFCI